MDGGRGRTSLCILNDEYAMLTPMMLASSRRLVETERPTLSARVSGPGATFELLLLRPVFDTVRSALTGGCEGDFDGFFESGFCRILRNWKHTCVYVSVSRRKKIQRDPTPACTHCNTKYTNIECFFDFVELVIHLTTRILHFRKYFL